MLETCCLCDRPFTTGKTYDLTEAEKALIGEDAPKSFSYCDGCLRVAQNLKQGAQVLRGYYERRLRERDVPNAGHLADQFHQRLVEAATRKMH